MENCVFCDRSQFEERLCGETKDFWIIATLGQISDGGYVLLVPKRHVECMGDMRQKEIELMGFSAVKIADAFCDEYGAVDGAIFEHGKIGQSIKHAHWHLIPEACYFSKKIEKNFSDCKITKLKSFRDLKKMYVAKKEPYIFWMDSDGQPLVCWNPPIEKVPPQYLRTVVAEALDRPERANWHNMDPELDKKLWSETVRRLKTYKF